MKGDLMRLPRSEWRVQHYREQQAIGLSSHLVEMSDGSFAFTWDKVLLSDLPNAEIPEEGFARFGLEWVERLSGDKDVVFTGFRPYLDEGKPT
ncbi:MAG: hypothetical protein ACMVO3_22700 [Thalassobaculum sp.]